ncbi:MAG TPA: PAS domain S-box protein [Candidatus Binataceae bacterium]
MSASILQSETNALLAAIIESSDDAIVSKTLDGIIQNWNRAAEVMFGYTAAEATGRHITLIIPPELRHEEDEILAKLRRGERIAHYETIRRTKDGRDLNISLTVSPIRDASGRVIGASKVARDITERKSLERDRERLLQWERDTRKQLSDAVSARDEFITVAAHELRNPLHVVHLTLQLLQRASTDSPRLAELVEKAGLQLRRLNTLVERLLDVTRVRSGTFELFRENFDMSVLVREIVARFANEPPATRITLELDATIRGSWDRLRIDQALTNLLSNAVKYGSRNPIGISASSDGSRVTIKVRDEGIGIGEEELPRIFDRFERLNAGSGREGLGLGLWIAKIIVEAHGGAILAESEVGKGSVFTVTLPLRQSNNGGRK